MGRNNIAETLRQQIAAEAELAERLREYAGKWVAVRNHEVVVHAPTLEELMEKVHGTGQEASVEVFEVSDGPESVLL